MVTGLQEEASGEDLVISFFKSSRKKVALEEAGTPESPLMGKWGNIFQEEQVKQKEGDYKYKILINITNNKAQGDKY